MRPPSAHTASAFGLAVSSSTTVPGLTAAAGDALPQRRCRLTFETLDELERDWPAAEVERVHEERFEGDERPARTIDRHPVLGYRLYARNFGVARIAADGTEVRCAQPDMPLWLWQRFLVGRILPIASVLQGLEAIHASAVAWGGDAVAIVAPSGVGKSSLALQLMLRGATFVTDDVLALEPTGESFRAYPGPATIGVRPDQQPALEGALERRGGRLLGRADKSYVEIPRAGAPRVLRALYMLRPAPAGTPAGIEQMRRIDPSALLSNTFVVWVRTPARLRTHLDVWARLASSVPCYDVTRPEGVHASELATVIEDHALGQLSRVAA